MKKNNLIFAAECIVIVSLLLVIGGLIKSEKRGIAKENTIEVEATAETQEIREELPEETPQALEVTSQSTLAETTEPSEEAPTIISTTEAVERNAKPQIVVFGDSIWNADRGNGGISEQIMEDKDVIIYNCAIGGTTAAVYNESVSWEEWTSNSFNGMMYLVTGVVETEELIPNDMAAKVFQEIDFNQVDYILISYGLNDYFCDIPIYPQTYYDLTSYVGALRHGIQKIREKYPHIKFIVTSPTYCGWFKDERRFELGEYVEAARSVSAEMDTYFIDMYHGLGKNPEEKMQYLEDGVHLNEEGRYLYARSVIDFLESQGIQ